MKPFLTGGRFFLLDVSPFEALSVDFWLLKSFLAFFA